jgi:hypothetical protein
MASILPSFRALVSRPCSGDFLRPRGAWRSASVEGPCAAKHRDQTCQTRDSVVLHHGRLPRRPPLVPRGGRRKPPPRRTLENIPARSPAGPAAVWVRIEARAQLAYQHSFVHVVARLVKLLRGLRGARRLGRRPAPRRAGRRRRGGADARCAVARDFSPPPQTMTPVRDPLWFPK